MDATILARALHVIGVVLWIGGVAFVTMVLLPAIRRLTSPSERVAFFEQIEEKFAGQAKTSTLLVGGSGFYLVHSWDLWGRFSDPSFFWMHAMVAIWALFSLMLFVAEPLFLHEWFLKAAEKAPEITFRRIERLHRGLLTVSLLTVFAAVAGSHGWHL